MSATTPYLPLGLRTGLVSILKLNPLEIGNGACTASGEVGLVSGGWGVGLVRA